MRMVDLKKGFSALRFFFTEKRDTKSNTELYNNSHTNIAGNTETDKISEEPDLLDESGS